MSAKDDFIANIQKFSEGLNIMSETDSDLTPFVWNFPTEQAFEKDNILKFLEKPLDEKFQLVEFDKFFAFYIKIKKDDDEETIEMAENFKKFKHKLTELLTDIKIFKVGEIEIDLYIVGKNVFKNEYAGLQAFVVET